MIADSPLQLTSLPTASPWSEIRTLYRRVCVLRAQGLAAAADQLASGDLARALASLRTTAHPGSESELRALFAHEENRVADATTLAEILLPLLRDAMPAVTSAASSPASPPTRPAPALPARTPRPAAAAERGIADFIDEMISLERDPGRASADLGSHH